VKLVLYEKPRSGNCYRVRLMLALLGLHCERVTVNTGDMPSSVLYGVTRHDSAADTRTEWYLRMNPRGQVPVLTADGEPIWDSIAIVAFLARQFDASGVWFPQAPLGA
jgi:glutathione S-transferase